MEHTFTDFNRSHHSQLLQRWKVLLVLSLGASIALLGYRLADFPNYFFCDEAIQGVEALSLGTSGKDTYGEVLPLFFRGHGAYQLSLSVYLHVPFQLLFGNSEVSVRLVNLLTGLLAIWGVALLARPLDRRSTLSAVTPLFFTLSPFFFLHMRSGFEFMQSLAGWIWLVVCFERGFSPASRRLRWVIGAAVAAAFSFYCYTPARGWIALSVVVLPVAYAGNCLRAKWRLILFWGVFFLLATPYLYTLWTHPEVALGRLRDMGASSWEAFDRERVERALGNGVEILSPTYWFSWSKLPRFESWERHVVPDMPLLHPWLVPFLPFGILLVLRRAWNVPLARALILLFPVGCFPAIFVATNPLRCAPIGVMFCLYGTLGVSSVGNWLFGRVRRVGLGGLVLLIVLIFGGVRFERYVFTEGVARYDDYGFYGVQYGAPQLFSWIRDNGKQYPRMFLTHAAFNGNNYLLSFYLADAEREKILITTVNRPCVMANDAQQGVWILREEQIQELLSNNCPVRMNQLSEVKAPNGKILFRMVELSVTGDIGQWMREKEEARHRLVTSQVTWRTIPISVEHTRFDSGNLEALFDEDPNSLVRSDDISPFTLRLSGFPAVSAKEVVVTVSHCVVATTSVTIFGRDTAINLGTDSQRGVNERCAFGFKVPSEAVIERLEVSVAISQTADNRVHLSGISLR